MNNTSQNVTLQDVVDFVHKCDDAGLRRITNAVQVRRNRLAQTIRFGVDVGATVSFTSTKVRSKYTYTGVIVEKRRVKAIVKITGPAKAKYPVGSLVQVPFAMLSVA